jgi:hypothetical protein
VELSDWFQGQSDLHNAWIISVIIRATY